MTVGGSGGMTAVTVTREVPLLLPGRPTVVVDSRALAVAELSGGASGPAPPRADDSAASAMAGRR